MPVNSIKIAIVDDHTLFRQGVSQILKRFPQFELMIEAESCAQLITALQEQLPDIILMDIEMPDVDGMEGCKMILKQFPDMKIIALSMHSENNFIFHMMKAGARSYLPKDIDQELLRQAIETVMEKGFHFTDAITTAMLQGVKSNSRQKPLLKYNESPLTQREKEILALICKGLTTGDIADQLYISMRTVEGHRKNLLEKTGTNNSVSLAVYALKSGMLD
jgi:DNA-binding NarL/FixJ family response regulator